MKKLFIAAFMLVSSFGTNVMADGHAIKMGIILGFTGPIESLTPAMAGSAELAFKEASDSGSLLGGKKIEVVRADSTCVDSAAATAAAEGVISQGVAAIMGADCSGVTGAIASNVAVPNGPHRLTSCAIPARFHVHPTGPGVAPRWQQWWHQGQARLPMPCPEYLR